MPLSWPNRSASAASACRCATSATVVSRRRRSAPRRSPPAPSSRRRCAPFAPARWREALGSSGTVGAVSQAAARRRHHRRPHHAGRPALVHRAMPRRRPRRPARAARPEGRPARRARRRAGDPLHAGGAVRHRRAAAGARRAAPGRDLRSRRAPATCCRRARTRHDLRDASVRELQRRFAVDTRAGRARARAGAGAVRAASCRRRRHRGAQRELGWAGALHEIGMMVSHHDHHRHSAYLLGACRCAGLLAEPAAPRRRTGARPARRAAQARRGARQAKTSHGRCCACGSATIAVPCARTRRCARVARSSATAARRR